MQKQGPDGGVTTTVQSVLHDSWPCDHKRKADGSMETCAEAEARRVRQLVKTRPGITPEEVLEEQR